MSLTIDRSPYENSFFSFMSMYSYLLTKKQFLQILVLKSDGAEDSKDLEFCRQHFTKIIS